MIKFSNRVCSQSQGQAYTAPPTMLSTNLQSRGCGGRAGGACIIHRVIRPIIHNHRTFLGIGPMELFDYSMRGKGIIHGGEIYPKEWTNSLYINFWVVSCICIFVSIIWCFATKAMTLWSQSGYIGGFCDLKKSCFYPR